MTNYIVNIAVSQQVAPAPSTLQRTGALVTQGGTTLTPGTYQILTQASDLTSILRGAITVSTMTWSGGVVTVTLSGPHGIPSGDTLEGVITGVTPAAYNGTFNVTYTGANTFTYPLAVNPGLVTVQGSFTLENVQELVAMTTTYFAQGALTAVYVLELGIGDPAEGVTALTAYLLNPTLRFYRYLLPEDWAGEATASSLANTYSSPEALTYFHPTVTLGNYAPWAPYKSVLAFVQAATAPVTEFSAAALFYVMLNYNPTNVNLITPTAFSFLYGVTPLNPTPVQQTALKAAKLNYVDTGAEGGISNTILKWGTDMAGNDATFWYSADWVNINSHLMLANAIINGSNNPQNPLYYNQNGINRLKAVAQGVLNNGVTFGMISGAPLVTGVPFSVYVLANPSDYPLGIYNGLAVTFTPSRGFSSVTFFLTVSSFAAA